VIEKIVAALAAHKIAIEKNIDASAATIAALQSISSTSEKPSIVDDTNSYEVVMAKLDRSGVLNKSTDTTIFLKQLNSLDFRLTASEERISSLEKMVQSLSEVLTK